MSEFDGTFERVTPDWVKDAIKNGDIVTVYSGGDRDIPVVGPFGNDSISLKSLIDAYNKMKNTDYRLDVDALDECL